MLIQQSMTRLSSNEAYAYIGREDLDAFTNTQVPKVPDEDEDPSKLGLLLRAEQYVIKTLFHSTWSVTLEDVPAAAEGSAAAAGNVAAGVNTSRQDVLSVKLLKQYQDSVAQWSCKTLEATVLEPEGVQPDTALRDLWKKYLESKQIYDTENPTPIDFRIPAKLYDPRVAYSIICRPMGRFHDYSYVLTANLPALLRYSSSENMSAEPDRAEYTAIWGSSLVKFTLESRDVTDSFVKAVTSQAGTLLERLKQYLEQGGNYETTDEEDDNFGEMLASLAKDAIPATNERREVNQNDADSGDDSGGDFVMDA